RGADGQGPAPARASGDRSPGAGTADRRAVLEVDHPLRPPAARREAVLNAAPQRPEPPMLGRVMLDFQVPRISSESVDDTRGSFTIEPLDRGFGYTFGNSLRRVLLSSLEGAAVTSVKLEGVAHEFTTLPGVREDVTNILLNLKQLVCVLHGESPEVEVRLTAKGEGTVTAADIECPADL